MASRPTALGVYLFAGGFSAGVESYFRVIAQLEDGPYGAKTVKANWPRRPLHSNPEEWPLEQLAGHADIVFANPPCAPWSTAGVSKKKSQAVRDAGVEYKWELDPRVSCVIQTFDVLKTVRPRIWAWESVQGAFKRGRKFVDHLTEQALDMGYSVTYWLHNALDIGVPQTRRRFFMIAHDVELDIPQPNRSMKTVRDVIGHLSDVDPDPDDFEWLPRKYEELYEHSRPGDGLRDVFERIYPEDEWERYPDGRVKNRPAWSLTRLHWDAPTPTIVRGNFLAHPEYPRWLSVTEAKLLCGYPADFKLVRSSERKNDRFQQISQAVMPAVGRYLACYMRKAIDADVRVTEPTVRTLDHDNSGYSRKAHLRELWARDGILLKDD